SAYRFRSSFADTPSTGVSALSLHDALPILTTLAIDFGLLPLDVARIARIGLERERERFLLLGCEPRHVASSDPFEREQFGIADLDRKSTRLNSSHVKISYAVFCLKKKKPTT